jgi:hypothetical protein
MLMRRSGLRLLAAGPPINSNKKETNKMKSRFRGASEQRHQKPYRDTLSLTDVPAGSNPYRGPGSMDVVDMNRMGEVEGSSARFPQSENNTMTKRDNG